MASMQQLTYVKANQLEWHEVRQAEIQTGIDAIVRPIAVARCDLDYYIALGLYGSKGQFAIGHEMVAVVTEVGHAVKRVVPGDLVIVPFQISCGTCSHCSRGWTNACLEVPPCAAYGLGTNPDGEFGGAFSDAVRVPYADHMLVHLPDGLTPEAACGLSDNVADGYRTVAKGLQRFPGEPVLIAGGLAQSVGLYAVHCAIMLGSRRVVYADFDPTRLSLAKAAGAETVAVDYAKTTRHQEDFLISVDASAMPEGLLYALKSTGPCGYCTGVSGGLTASTSLPLSSLYLKGITYEVSRVHSSAVLPQVLGHACKGELNPLSIVGRKASFEEAIEAMFDPAPKVIFSRGTHEQVTEIGPGCATP
ncbi:MAG: alcohol dehydrogenase catalytic domain-containing protein [Halioglobus sp.]